MPYVVIPDSDERGLSSERGGNYTQTESWKVLVDTPAPSLLSIQAAVGVYVGSAGPSGTKCSNVRVRGSEDRYLYRVTAEYARLEKVDNPLSVSPKFQWVGSITGQRQASWALGPTTGQNNHQSSPLGVDYTCPIVNSAFDPIEGVMGDVVEARLRIVVNKATFSSSTARTYIGTVNKFAYAGGDPFTWKCVSIEASEQEAQVDDGTGTGSTVAISYWQVTAELAWNEEGWASKPWDIGYNEIYGSGKRRKICVPRIQTLPGYSTADTDDAKAKNGLLISQHAAHDQQALYSVDDPQADASTWGTAKPDGQPPSAREFHLSRALPWAGVFPEPPA